MRGLAANTPHPLLIGMIHLAPLPGTPLHRDGTLSTIVDDAVADARALAAAGADGCLIQTVDLLYSNRDEADPARVAAITVVAAAVRAATGPAFEVGVQLMRNAVRASLGVAAVVGGTFVRATALVGATLSPHGFVEADPLGVMAYRRSINGDDIAVIADVWTDHYRWFGGEKPVGEVARLAAGVGAGAVAISERDPDAALAVVATIRNAAPAVPILLAAHTRHDTVGRLLPAVDGVLVGSCLKKADGSGRIDPELAERYVTAARSAR